MSNCGCPEECPEIEVTNCIDCLPPESPCVNGEPCEDTIPAECVIYNGDDLECSGIKKLDRVSVAIQKIDALLCTYPSVFHQEDTDTVDLTGDGTNSNKLKADVRIDPHTDNIIYKTSNGIIARVTPAIVIKILNIINDNPDILTLFCSLVAQCSNSSCTVSTNLEAEMS